MAIDPVCKMEVDRKAAAASSEYKGRTYYFCAPGCKKAFDADPDKYLAGSRNRPVGCSPPLRVSDDAGQ